MALHQGAVALAAEAGQGPPCPASPVQRRTIDGRTPPAPRGTDPSITHPLDHGLTGAPNVLCQGETRAAPYLVKGSASGATHHAVESGTHHADVAEGGTHHAVVSGTHHGLSLRCFKNWPLHEACPPRACLAGLQFHETGARWKIAVQGVPTPLVRPGVVAIVTGCIRVGSTRWAPLGGVDAGRRRWAPLHRAPSGPLSGRSPGLGAVRAPARGVPADRPRVPGAAPRHRRGV